MPKSGQPWDQSFLAGHPLFRAFEPFARPLRTPTWPGPEDFTRVCAEFCIRSGLELSPLSFRAMQKKSRREKRSSVELERLYDGSITLSGEVPCLRESYHDLLNAIVFCAFPRAKRALHARQFRALKTWLQENGVLGDETSAPRLPGARSREQDALTIFDEGGTVLLFTERAHEKWRGARTRLSLEDFGPDQVLPLLFGHALLEHLVEGQRALRSSGVVMVLPEPKGELLALAGEKDVLELFAYVDARLAERLEDPKEFRLPGADSIFELSSGKVLVGPPKPAWHLPNSSDALRSLEIPA